ncbi:MAG: tetratricopeptide repeat protein [Pseudomonadota bacterium]
MADSLIREVDEALRADKIDQFWAKYRAAILFFCVALVVATAAVSMWNHYQEKRGGALMLRFAEAQVLFESGTLDEAAAGYAAIAADTSGELRDLAQLWQARALISAEKTSAAVPVLKDAASNGKSLWADIACLRLAGIDAKEATCLSDGKASPLASEKAQWAAASQWAAGDHDGAIASIEKQIADAATSPDARARLSQWLLSMKAQK